MSGRAAGPNPIDVRIVEQKGTADAKDLRVEIGFRPSCLIIFNLDDTITDSTMAVVYDGFQNSSGVRQGGVKWKGGGAPALMTEAAGVKFEARGYVLGTDPDISRAGGGHLLCIALGEDAPIADLSKANATKKLPANGGFGTGASFNYDANPPVYDWIGPTS